jgi:hypothetical protein
VRAGSSMYVPTNEADEPVSGLYSSNRLAEDYSSSAEETNFCSTAVVPSPPPGMTTTTRNMAMERTRHRKLNERLYALQSVVPNITKVVRALHLSVCAHGHGLMETAW